MLARLLLVAFFATPAAAEPFSFVALGDTTYARPADDALYRKLIEAINNGKPAFSIHVGDTKGHGDCGRAFQESERRFFDLYQAPVFYAPGNNEWADCWKANRGSADPTEILELMREVFWSEPRASARGATAGAPGRRTAGFAEFAENARWTYGGATLRDAQPGGTYNNQELRVETYWREFVRREQANRRLGQGRLRGRPARASARVVLAFHSNPSTRTCATRAVRSRPCCRRSPPKPTPSTARCSSSTATTTPSPSTVR